MPVEKNKIELSPTQKGMYFDCLMNDPIAYNLSAVIELENLQPLFFENALKLLIAEQATLRSGLTLINDIPALLIHEEIDFRLETYDLGANLELQQEKIRAHVEETISTPFDLNAFPLFRAKLLKIENNKYIFILCAHHIITDGVSFNIFIKKALKFYNQLLKKEVTALKKDQGFFHFIGQENLNLAEGKYNNQREFWEQKIRGIVPLRLPGDDYAKSQTGLGKEKRFALNKEIVAAITQLSMDHEVTVFMFFLAAFSVLMNRYTQSENIAFTSPFSYRPDFELEETIGCFIHMLTLQFHIDEEATFAAVLQLAAKEYIAAYKNIAYPNNLIAHEKSGADVDEKSSIFDVIFVYDIYEEMHNGEVKANVLPQEIVTFPGNLMVVLNAMPNEETWLKIQYKPDVFVEETIELLGDSFVNLVKILVANVDVNIKDIPLVFADKSHSLNSNKLCNDEGETASNKTQLNDENNVSNQKSKGNIANYELHSAGGNIASNEIQNDILSAKGSTSNQIERGEKRLTTQQNKESSRTELINTITSIWKEVLSIDAVGIDSNFFDLGGHSFSLIQVNNKLRHANLALPIKLQFQLPTIRLLVDHFTRSCKKIPPVTSVSELHARKNPDSEKRTPIEKIGSVRAKEKDIAIIGLSINVPGASSIDTFWRNLKNGQNSIYFYSDEELKEMGIAQEVINAPNFVKASGHIQGVDYFDPNFFDYTPTDVELMSPQYRVLYPALWEAFEDAGYYPNSDDATIGLYLSGSDDFEWYKEAILNQNNYSQKYQAFTLSTNHFLATRLAYKLDIKGPVFTVLSGCSSSLVATHLACQSLMLGECDIAVAGGVTVELPIGGGYFFEEGMMFSPDGNCRPFDAKAEGTFFSHGLGLVVLKKLTQAIEDGDQIYAVIKGAVINNDGAQKLGFTAPSVDGQAQAIQKAYQLAGISPETVSYVEAHGTGTSLGDPIEIESLIQAFATDKKQFCVLGSVKGNVGHPDTASGAVSLVKVALSLKHKYIPATVNFSTPNPKIDFANSPFIVKSEGEEWVNTMTDSTLLRAGINSFGVGGTNVHMVVEESPTAKECYRSVVKEDRSSLKNTLFVFSAKSATALSNTTEKVLHYIHQHPNINLDDASWTMQVGRKPFAFRKALLINEEFFQLPEENIRQTVKEAFSYHIQNDDRSVYFMFSGQGSQYQGMARELYYSAENNVCSTEGHNYSADNHNCSANRCNYSAKNQGIASIFKQQFDTVIQLLPLAEAEELLEIVFGNKNPQTINETKYSQLALFIIEYSLAKTLIALGIVPKALLGHSIGEITAATVAGVFTLKNAIEIVRMRGQIMQQQKPGTMLAVLGDINLVRQHLDKDVWLALENTTNSFVVGGDSSAIAVFEEKCMALDLATARIKTSHAFHTPMMAKAAQEFGEKIASYQLNEPQIPILSNISGTWANPEDLCTSEYWAKHIVNPVNFANCLAEVLQDKNGIFIEIGPGHILTSFAKQHNSSSSTQDFINLLRHPKECVEDVAYFYEKIGHMWCAGLAIDWHVLKGDAYRCRISLPTYVFDKEYFPIDLKPNNLHTTEEQNLRESQLDFSLSSSNSQISLTSSETRISLSSAQIMDKTIALYKEVLGFSTITSQQDFFVLGGDSLKAINLANKVNSAFNVKIAVKDIFKYPTPAALSSFLQEHVIEKGEIKEGIPLAPTCEYYPLSSAQMRMYALYLLDKESLAYNLPSATIIRGNIDKERFESALRKLIQRHESLRTSFKLINSRPVQIISAQPDLPLTYFKCIANNKNGIEQCIAEFIKPFDLYQGPLYRMALVNLGFQEHLFLFDIHHIIADGTSLEIISRDFNTLYSKELPSLNIQYKDFAVWQNKMINTDALNAEKQFWLNYLHGDLTPLTFPTDFARAPIRQSAGNRIYFTLDKELANKIINFSKVEATTLFMTFLSAWNILLARYSNQEDIIVGVPIAGRQHKEIAETVGMFINILPIRNQHASDITFKQFLAKVKENVLEAFSHQNYQFDDLIQQLRFERDLSRNALFDVCFDFQNMEFHDLHISDLEFIPYSFKPNTAAYDLLLTCQENKQEETIQGFIDYNTTLFKEGTIERIIANFKTILQEIITDPEILLENINLIADKEKSLLHQLGNSNKIPLNDSLLIHHLFEQNAAIFPQKTALILADGNYLTYAQLNAKANDVAFSLLELGITKDHLVGVMTTRDASLFIAMLGILKAGAGFVLIDSSLPQERIKYLLNECSLHCLLCAGKSSVLENFKGKIVNLDTFKYSNLNRENPIVDTTNNYLAYVMFTSGSTGKPKGVMVNHASVINFIYDINSQKIFKNFSDRIISVTSVSFDIFIFESLVPLATGNSIYLANEREQLDPCLANRKIIEHKVTHILSTISRIKIFVENSEFKNALKQLQCILTGGENFPLSFLKELQKQTQAKIYNMYGPTETTIWSTTKELTKANNVNIGKPITNTSITIVNKKGKLQPIGVFGELCISGLGVARGYLHSSPQSCEKFIYNLGKDVIYKTGDKARLLDNGEIELQGRLDSQIKVRGYRVELQELESIALEHTNISQAAVVAIDKNGNTQLVLYFCFKSGVSNTVKEQNAFKRWIKERVPHYMIPSEFILIDKMPFLPNGKVDKSALLLEKKESKVANFVNFPGCAVPDVIIPVISSHDIKTHEIDSANHEVAIGITSIDMAPTCNVSENNASLCSFSENNPSPCSVSENNASPCSFSDSIAPHYSVSDIERILFSFWQEVLVTDKIPLDENFFDLGGHSLGLIQINNKLNLAMGFSVPLLDLFQYATIESLAKHLYHANKARQEKNLTVAISGIKSGAKEDEERDQKEINLLEKKQVEKAYNAQKENGQTEEIQMVIDQVENSSIKNGPIKMVQSEGNEIEKSQLEKSQMEIAVIGIAGKFPGAETIDDFWNNIANGIDSITHFEQAELLNAGISAELLDDPLYVRAKGFLENAEYFDAQFFGYSHQEANCMDPQLRMLHQITWEVLENAGYSPFNYSGQIGLFAGGSSNVLWLNTLIKNPEDFLHAFEAVTLNERDFFTTRLSYKLNLTGPSVNIQTACSTSLAAVHQAVQSLCNGECQMAIAGGVAISYPRKEGYLWHEGMIFSRDGKCKPFAADASGIIPGNGCGLVLLKPLAKAVEDNDHIYAVIKSSAINNDGIEKIGYTAPSINGQCAVIKSAMEKSGLQPEQITYLEAHGTGTKLGDPIEIEAVKKAWATDKKNTTALGSVKANVGHLDTAAGIASLIKAILVLHNRAIPPLAHFQRPNPMIDFENSPFYINTSLEKITDPNKILRAGVSSFGIGGTNVHVILEQAPLVEKNDTQDPIHILLFSARTPASLANNCYNIVDYLQKNSAINLSDAAWTLQVGRKAFAYRKTLIVEGSLNNFSINDLNNFRQNDGKKIPLTKKSLIFTFSQAEQFAYEMIGCALYSLADKSCIASIFKANLDKVIASFPNPERAVFERLFAEKINPWDESLQSIRGLTQFAINYALAKFLMALGLTPLALMGEGIGEIIALALANVISLADVIDLIKNHPDIWEGKEPGTLIEMLTTGITNYKLHEPSIPFLIKGNIPRKNRKSIAEVLESDNVLFIEVSANKSIQNYLNKFFAATKDLEFKNILGVENDASANLLHLNQFLGELWCNGVEINWQKLYGTSVRRRVPLPTYAFDKGYYNNDVSLQSHNPKSQDQIQTQANTQAPSHIQSQFKKQDKSQEQAKEDAQSHKQVQEETHAQAQPYRHIQEKAHDQPHKQVQEEAHAQAQPQSQTQDQAGQVHRLQIQTHFQDAQTSIPIQPSCSSDRFIADIKKTPEQLLASIWIELFGCDEIKHEDDFFILGGDSLKAIVLAAHIKKTFGINIPLDVIFNHSHFSDLLKWLSHHTKNSECDRAIQVVEKQPHYPTSSAQKRMYAVHSLLENATPYNLGAVYTIEGKLDLVRFKNAFDTLVQRHEAFRTKFAIINGEVVQSIEDAVPSIIEYEEFEGKQLEEKIAQYIRPFDLSQAPLLRIKLCKISENEHILLIDMHHIIADQSSISILLREFENLYFGRTLPELPLQYKDFAVWQNELFTQARGQQQLEYWKNEFQGEIPVLNLPTDFPRPRIRAYDGSRISLRLSRELSQKIDNFASKNSLTPYMFFMAALNLVLSKYTGQNDVVIGTATAGRRHADLLSLVGMFVNTLAIRIQLQETWTIAQYVNYIKDKMLKAYENQDCPFELFIDELQLEKDLSRNPLFDVVINYIDMGESELKVDGLSLSPWENLPVYSKFDLTWTIEKKAAHERGINAAYYDTDIEFNTSLYSLKTIENLANKLLYIISYLLDNSSERLREISLLTPQERQRILYDYNDTATNYPQFKTISQLFTEQVEIQGKRTAIIWQNENISYNQLYSDANKIATLLDLKAVKPGSKIGILLDRSPLQIACILGILQYGCAYVPIDPQYPEIRMQFMLNDSDAKLVLTHTSMKSIPAKFPCIFLDTEKQFLDLQNRPYLQVIDGGHTQDSAAYVMYTSGSTGEPKGIQISHRNVISLVKNSNFIEILPSDRLLQLSNFVFDGSVFDIFGALLNGASLLMLHPQQIIEMSQLVATIKKETITVVYFPTALFNSLIEWDVTALQTIRKVLIGGEAASVPHVRKAFVLLGPQRLINVYGPTEATVFASYYEIKQLENSCTRLPIGVPLSNKKLYVLDKNGQPVPENVIGELYIGGTGVAEGYVNREELTRQKFLKNPFEATGHYFRTGDLVQRISTGDLVYINRVDTQVKVRGFRVELGEIEAQIKKINGINNAIVVIQQDRNDETFIAAYYTVSDAISFNISAEQIRENLSQNLPEFMLPARIIRLTELPLNTNGKIDVKAISTKKIFETSSQNANEKDSIEQIILREMRSILDCPTLTREDNFFQCGGHSIKAITLVHMLSKEGISLKVSEVFQQPTAKKLASLYKLKVSTKKGFQLHSQQENDNENDPVSLNEKHIDSLVEHIHSTWAVISQMLGFSELLTQFHFSPVQVLHFHLGSRYSGFTTKIEGDISESCLRNVLIKVVQDNQLLHSVAGMDDTKSWHVYDIQPIKHLIEKHFPYIDLRIYAPQTQNEILNKLNASLVYTKYSIGNLPWRCCCLRLDKETHYIIWSFDHIAFDGRSAEILRSQIEQLIAGFTFENEDEESKDLQLPQNYEDYVGVLKKGPENISENNIIASFALREWASSNELIMKRLNHPRVQKQVEIDLEFSLSAFDIQEPWHFAFDLTIKLLQQHLGVEEVPLGIVHYGRSYHGQDYYNCVGEFLDIMPVLVKSSDRELTLACLVEQSRKLAINFIALVFDPILKIKFPYIHSLLFSAFEPSENMLNLILFNFQGFVSKENKDMFKSLSTTEESHHFAKFLIAANYDEENLTIRFTIPEKESSNFKKLASQFMTSEVEHV